MTLLRDWKAELPTLALALDGDESALRDAFRAISDGAGATRRTWPGLALAAASSGHDLEVPEPVQQELRRVAGRYLLLTEQLDQAGRALARSNVPWAPIKGMDLVSRGGAYSAPEARPTADLDLLVFRDNLDRARDALLDAGWTPLNEGSMVERYLRDEGYAWQARGPDGGLLELHYRLWGSVAADVGDAMLTAANPEDDEIATTRRRLRPEHAYILAATHCFLDMPPKRDVIDFRDLCVLSRSGADSEAIVAAADDFDLQMPVAIAAKVSFQLWEHPTDEAVVDGLRPKLRLFEKSLLRDHPNLEAIALPGMASARYFARRRMRHGFHRLLLRRVWAHPGIVEASGLSRWAYQLAVFGLRPVAGAEVDIQ